MTSAMAFTKTEFSCRPVAAVPVDKDAADLLDRVLTALEADRRAHGPVCGYEYDEQQLDAIFQVEITTVGEQLDTAAALARQIFDDALATAGVDARTTGVAIVEGGDPDQLP